MQQRVVYVLDNVSALLYLMTEECILVAILLYTLVEADGEEKLAFDGKVECGKIIIWTFGAHRSGAFLVGILLVLVPERAVGRGNNHRMIEAAAHYIVALQSLQLCCQIVFFLDNSIIRNVESQPPVHNILTSFMIFILLGYFFLLIFYIYKMLY